MIATGGPAPGPRHPLLPAKNRTGRPQQHPPHHRQRHRHRAWLPRQWAAALVLLLLLLGAAAYLYRRAALSTPFQDAGAEEEQRDSAVELRLLHEQPSRAFCARAKPPLVCAHGGDVSAAPPNTAAAFAAALAGGARCVEVDVARTKDGQLVVLHARELSQLLRLAGRAAPRFRSKGRGPPQVGDFTWAQLSALRWEGGERVERVEDVVRMVLGGTDQITLDVKTYSQAGEELDEDVMAQETVNLVTRTACAHCLVWAKSDAVVRMVKELLPTQLVGYVVINETAAARAAGMHRLLRMPGAEVIALHFAMASAELTQQAWAARKQVHAWTANTAGMMAAVLDAGVDAVVTNHPRKVEEAVQSRLRRCPAVLRGEEGEGRGEEGEGRADGRGSGQAAAAAAGGQQGDGDTDEQRQQNKQQRQLEEQQQGQQEEEELWQQGRELKQRLGRQRLREQQAGQPP